MVSYMYDLPARVGHSEALDAAIASVATVLRWRNTSNMYTQDFASDAWLKYGRALQMLQRAVENAEQSLTPEVLCATELLCIFEALSGNELQAYIQHAAGAAKLIQHRGVSRFSSEFEKSLLAARLPIFIIESHYRGDALFLAQEQWLEVLQDCVLSSPKTPDRSEVAISLYSVVAYLSGQFADVKTFMQNGADDEEHRRAQLRRVGKSRNRLLHWYQRWEDYLFWPTAAGNPVNGSLIGEQGREGKQLELICVHEAFLLSCSRLCIALDANNEHAVEQKSLTMARAMTGGQDFKKNDPVRAIAHGLCASPIHVPIITSCVGVASVVLSTTEEWAAAMRQRKAAVGDEKKRCFEPSVVLSFLQAIGFDEQVIGNATGADKLQGQE
ncbi:hypothetical protein NLG97_g9624 [Lecanicillium saksenae]|uniref:Uncharacterized protein n=1 Tax=Lecanicillium saksenae TaxID=468837 RepID=A0ACC1QJF6_9HYPO|nr:hypothetical protein NLG97_g9624 [Lecanicillium saksenae]